MYTVYVGGWDTEEGKNKVYFYPHKFALERALRASLEPPPGKRKIGPSGPFNLGWVLSEGQNPFCQVEKGIEGTDQVHSIALEPGKILIIKEGKVVLPKLVFTSWWYEINSNSLRRARWVRVLYWERVNKWWRTKTKLVKKEVFDEAIGMFNNGHQSNVFEKIPATFMGGMQPHWNWPEDGIPVYEVRASQYKDEEPGWRINMGLRQFVTEFKIDE